MDCSTAIGAVDDDEGSRARVTVDPVSRQIVVLVRDADGAAVIGLPPFRARAMISVLQEALRHLED